MGSRLKAAGASSRPASRKVRAPLVRDITADYVESLKQYSRLLLDGGLCPGDVKRPEAVAVRIEVGRDVGLSATQAVAWIAIVNGRPSIYGDAAMGLIRASGELSEGYPVERFEGEGDDFAAVVIIRRNGGTERVSRFSVADAKRAKLWGKKGPWSDYPERMLMWRAKGFACRDEFPDVLCGLVFKEEAEDIADAEVVGVRRAESEPAALPAATPPAAELFSLASPPPADPTPAAPPVPLDGPVTDAQLERIADLRAILLASRGLSDTDPAHESEVDSVWADSLRPFGVTSARKLKAGAAAELITDLARDHDPFGFPCPFGKPAAPTCPPQAPTTTPESAPHSAA